MTKRFLTLMTGLMMAGASGLPVAHAAATAAVQDARAQAPAAVLALMERVADWQLAHPTESRGEDWTDGVGDAGFMALAGISGNARYRDAMVAMGEKNHWKLGPRPYHADDHVVGQSYAELYQMLRDPKMIAPMRAQFDAILAEPYEGPLDFTLPGVQRRWAWCDALFMGPPAWARLAHVTGDPRYLEFAVRRWWQTSDYLYDKEEHLYFRDSRYFDKREANGKKVFWGRGNGWVMGGLARMLQYLPANHPARARFCSAACCRCRQTTSSGKPKCHEKPPRGGFLLAPWRGGMYGGAFDAKGKQEAIRPHIAAELVAHMGAKRGH